MGRSVKEKIAWASLSGSVVVVCLVALYLLSPGLSLRVSSPFHESEEAGSPAGSLESELKAVDAATRKSVFKKRDDAAAVREGAAPKAYPPKEGPERLNEAGVGSDPEYDADLQAMSEGDLDMADPVVDEIRILQGRFDALMKRSEQFSIKTHKSMEEGDFEKAMELLASALTAEAQANHLRGWIEQLSTKESPEAIQDPLMQTAAAEGEGDHADPEALTPEAAEIRSLNEKADSLEKKMATLYTNAGQLSVGGNADQALDRLSEAMEIDSKMTELRNQARDLQETIPRGADSDPVSEGDEAGADNELLSEPIPPAGNDVEVSNDEVATLNAETAALYQVAGRLAESGRWSESMEYMDKAIEIEILANDARGRTAAAHDKFVQDPIAGLENPGKE